MKKIVIIGDPPFELTNEDLPKELDVVLVQSPDLEDAKALLRTSRMSSMDVIVVIDRRDDKTEEELIAERWKEIWERKDFVPNLSALLKEQLEKKKRG